LNNRKASTSTPTSSPTFIVTSDSTSTPSSSTVVPSSPPTTPSPTNYNEGEVPLAQEGDAVAQPGDIVAQVGGGGYGDFSDGIIRTVSDVISLYNEIGGDDEISTGDGDNVAIGGFGEDTIRGGDERDVMVRCCLVLDDSLISHSPLWVIQTHFCFLLCYPVWRLCHCVIL
jgi:hypothetical protein